MKMSKKKTKQENATILTKKRKTYSWLEDTPWVDSKEELDLTLRHDTGSENYSDFIKARFFNHFMDTLFMP